MAAWGTGFLHRVRGEPDIAEGHLERAFRVAEEWKLEWWLAQLGWLLGHAKAMRDPGEGIPIVREALARFEACGFGPFRTLVMINLSEALLAAEQVDKATTTGLNALGRARTQGERGHEAWALWLLGDVTAQSTTEAAEAHDRYHASRSLAEELGMRPLVAHCHLGHGKLYQRTGGREQAQKHLATATAMYREMGMTYWLDQAESEARR